MYAFGKLEERLINAFFHFIPDGTVISTVTIGKAAKPAEEAFTDDYKIGDVNNAKYVPQTKDRKREYALLTGGYKERNTKIIVEDAFEITVINYASKLYDELAFGLASAPVADTAQQSWATAARYKDGWVQLTFRDEQGVVLGSLTNHMRLEIATHPEIKNEDGSPVWRITHLADAGALDTYLFEPAA